ncbi:hypothetical protein [Planotetraspora kaengkrachanensis]|uniref:Uncharacterized protein n=1 Tax=Planotetraspora kaengkrachanensis TaxID=575193 RepID=A0A8J3PXD7_9ACTN|nr:hypothetical protein [Planotetraspora kaengkrachanensis]GIG82717.1 hypothetical protein Pka01_58440 [Planotetraspora kaengkrachanensis]
MPNFKSLVGALAISTALTGGAVALGATVTTSAANASTVMGCGGGCGGGGCGRSHNRNHNRNHNRQWQQEHQRQHQNQHLMRDFTLIVSPFQNADTKANPWQRQDGDSTAKAFD